MARVSGKTGNVNTASNVSGIKSWTLDYKFDAIEGTGFDSSGHKVYTPGLDGWSGSFEGLKEGVPLTIGTEVALILYESSTTNMKFNGNAIITGLSAKATVEGLAEYSYDFQGTGALVIPTA